MAIPLEFGEAWFSFAISGDNEPMYSHLAYGVSATVTQAAVNAGFQAFIDAFKVRFSASLTLTGGHFLEQTTAGIRRWDAVVTAAVGTGGGTPLPNNCAYLVKKSTDLGGRRNRGRMYLPCPSEADVDGAGLVLSASVTALNVQTAKLLPGGAIHTAFGVLGDPVVLHESGSQTPATISSLTCQTKIATQRRRMRR